MHDFVRRVVRVLVAVLLVLGLEGVSSGVEARADDKPAEPVKAEDKPGSSPPPAPVVVADTETKDDEGEEAEEAPDTSQGWLVKITGDKKFAEMANEDADRHLENFLILSKDLEQAEYADELKAFAQRQLNSRGNPATSEFRTGLVLCRPSWVVGFIAPESPKDLNQKITQKQRREHKNGGEYDKVDVKTDDKRGEDGPSHCRRLDATLQQASSVAIRDEDTLVLLLYKDGAVVPFQDIATLQVKTQVVGSETEGERIMALPDFRSTQLAERKYMMFRVGSEQLGDNGRANIQITVVAKDRSGEEFETIGYAQLKRQRIGYGVTREGLLSRYKSSPVGVWFPLALMGAHFSNMDDKGLSFQAIPVPLALGSRVPTRGGSYIGISGFVGPTLFEADKEEETEGGSTEVTGEDSSGTEVTVTVDEEPATEKSTPFSLTGMAFGVLVDINDMLLVGAGYTLDFRAFAKKKWQEKHGEFKHPGFGVYVSIPIGINKGKL